MVFPTISTILPRFGPVKMSVVDMMKNLMLKQYFIVKGVIIGISRLKNY